MRGEALVPTELAELAAELGDHASEAAGTLSELRQTACGIHPGILAREGSIRLSARRSTCSRGDICWLWFTFPFNLTGQPAARRLRGEPIPASRRPRREGIVTTNWLVSCDVQGGWSVG
ncbi:hypothetical protein [Amycolatopsis sp. NPDC001319]|uniref:hypothetical protein n=1 Tax=unclassified Amycolatopsis TaxID=2618356 RepID=UPI0036C2E216